MEIQLNTTEGTVNILGLTTDEYANLLYALKDSMRTSLSVRNREQAKDLESKLSEQAQKAELI